MKNAVIMFGLPLSGKTTYIKDNQLIFKDYELISADDIKVTLEGYDPRNVTEEIHQKSVALAKERIVTLTEPNNRKDFVFDSGSINNNYTAEIIQTLAVVGYRVTLVHIDTPVSVCIERLKTRERQVPVDNLLYKETIKLSKLRHLESLKNPLTGKPAISQLVTVRYYTNKHIFIDMDGVLASHKVLLKLNGTLDFVNSELFRYLKPVYPVINKFNDLVVRKKYILSGIPNSFAYEEKNEWLDKYFPIPKSQRFFVNQGRHKIEMLENLLVKLKIDKKDAVLVDDTHDILEQGMSKGINCVHVSEFLADQTF